MIEALRPKSKSKSKSKSEKIVKYIELDTNEVISVISNEPPESQNVIHYSSDNKSEIDLSLTLFDLRFFCGEYLELNKDYLCKDVLLNIKEQNEYNHYLLIKEYLSTKYSPLAVDFTIEYGAYHRVKDVIFVDDNYAYIPIYLENIAWNLLKHINVDKVIKLVDHKIIINSVLYKRDEFVFDFNNRFCERCKVQNICTKIL